MKKILLIAFLALILLSLAPAQAMNITMSNPGGIALRDIIVYDSHGQMYGYYNSSSVISVNGTEDYIFTMKPLSANPLEDPTDWLANTALPYVASGAIALIIIVFLARLWK
jgi:hypothetical protein